jgi:tetratricopeptide (TPR) repeat protein
MRTPAATFVLVILIATTTALSGCGDPALWARYRAERGNWRAQKLVDRIRVNPRLASPRDYRRARDAYEHVARSFPASRWGRPATATERDVAVAAGTASIAVAELDASRGDYTAALSEFSRAGSDWSAIPEIALAAAIGNAEVRERLGRAAEAAVAWRAIAEAAPLVDGTSHQAIAAVMEAPLRAAALFRLLGRNADADSVLATGERREREEARRGGAAAVELWVRLADLSAARGDLTGALHALREALNRPDAAARRPNLVMTMAQMAYAGGRPDTALAYATWADTGLGRAVRPAAQMLVAEAWQAARQPDSALVAYQRFIDHYPQNADSSARARFERGVIFEETGRWEQARSEYRGLEAAQPTHALAFASLLRIVNHHATRGETDLAHLEAQQALEKIDVILQSQRDETVQLQAKLTRARLLELMGRNADACDTFTEVWRGYGRTPDGTRAGFDAARLAERALHDPARARGLYQEVADRASDESSRRAARAAADRLRGSGE